ncbi:MAG: hypothetical protein KAI74_04270 [Kiritimatiellae bacterium]|nr:hypothetical protein [Kiritimatiellia bacterium]
MDIKKILLSAIVVLFALSPVLEAGGLGEGVVFGKFIFRPYIDGSVTHDSNPFLAQTNLESDIFIEYEVGANLLFKGKSLDVYGSVFWTARNYFNDNAGQDWLHAPETLDFYGFGESLALRWGSRDKLQIRARESFQQVTDYSRQPYSEAYTSEYTEDSFLAEDRGNRLERNLINANISAGRDLTYKTELDITASFLRTDYVSEDVFDIDESTLHGELAYKLTDKSYMLLVSEYGVQVTDALPGDPESKIIRVGWKTKFTDKTAFKGSFGMEYYDDNTVSELGLDSKYEMPSFDLGWLWMPTDKLSINTSGANTIEPSSYEILNIRKVMMIGSSAGYQLTRSLMAWLGVSYRKDNYKYEDPAHDVIREINAYGGKTGIKYAPHQKWYSIYATAGYENTDSSIDVEDFEQFRFTLGAKLIY